MTKPTAPWQWRNEAIGPAVDRYFDFLHRSIQVNRAFAHGWVHAVRGAFDGGRDEVSAIADAVAGHEEAVEAWLLPRYRTLDDPTDRA